MTNPSANIPHILASRRNGCTVAIGGDYQYRAIVDRGHAVGTRAGVTQKGLSYRHGTLKPSPKGEGFDPPSM